MKYHKIKVWLLRTARWPFGAPILIVWLLIAVVFLVVVMRSYTLGWYEATPLMIDVMTGGDLGGHSGTLEQVRWVWLLTWVVHVLAWLYIPVVIGVVIGHFIQKLNSTVSDAELESALRTWDETYGGPALSPESLRELMDYIVEVKESQIPVSEDH